MAFDPFGDFEARGYLRNAGGFHDKGEVSALEHRSFVENLPEALGTLRGRERIGYADLLETHAILFRDVYPWAGEDRRTTAPGIAVTKAGRSDLFAHPAETALAGGYALDEGQKPGRMRSRPGAVLGLLAHAHPFLDGNGRTIMTVHAELARRQGVEVDWARSERTAYLDALTRELTAPGRGALDAHVKPLLVEATGRPLAAAIAGIAGLNPAGRSATGADVGGVRIAVTRGDLEEALAARSAGGPGGADGPWPATRLRTPAATLLAHAGAGVVLAEHVRRGSGCVPTGRTLSGEAAMRTLLEGFGPGATRNIAVTPLTERAAMPSGDVHPGSGRPLTGTELAAIGERRAVLDRSWTETVGRDAGVEAPERVVTGPRTGRARRDDARRGTGL